MILLELLNLILFLELLAAGAHMWRFIFFERYRILTKKRWLKYEFARYLFIPTEVTFSVIFGIILAPIGISIAIIIPFKDKSTD